MRKPLFSHARTLGRLASIGAMVLIASTLAASTAGASNVGGGGCIAADANKTVVGTASGGKGSNSSFTTTKELIGQACLTRSNATTMRVSLNWHGVGRILSGAITGQLYDCTAKKWVTGSTHIVRLDYPNGSSTNYASKPSKAITVTKGHKYKVHITGTGQYKRYPGGTPSAGLGHFYPSGTNANTPKWEGSSICA